MAPAPKAPLHPIVEGANVFWGKLSSAMGMFSKIVKKWYLYSDNIILGRQRRADVKYSFEKAENAAYKIMEEQQKQRDVVAGDQKLRKRSGEEGYVADTDTSSSFDTDAFEGFLQELVEELVEATEKERE